MLRLSICFSLIITLGLALNACGGGGGGGGGGSASPSGGGGGGGGGATVTIGGATFNPSTSADFSRTAVGALLETQFRYHIYGITNTYGRTYDQITVSASGVSLPCWFDGGASLWALDTTDAIRQIGSAVKNVSTGVITPTLFTMTPSYFLPGGTLTDGQTFQMQPLTPSIVCTISLNQTSRDGATGCIKILIASPYGPDPTITIYNETWIKPGMGALWREKYRLNGSPSSQPDSGDIYSPVSG